MVIENKEVPNQESVEPAPEVHPAVAASAPVAEPEDAGKALVEKTISGKSFKVEEGLAGAIDELTSGVNAKLNETSQELGRLRAFETDTLRSKIPEIPSSINNEASEALATKLYENPAGFVKDIENTIVKKVTGMYNAVENVKTREGKFWDSFWKENPNLAKMKDVVRDKIETSGYGSRGLQDTRETRDLIAKDITSYVLDIATHFGGGNDKQDPAAFIEGSTNQLVKLQVKQEPVRKSTTDIIREQKEAKLAVPAG